MLGTSDSELLVETSEVEITDEEPELAVVELELDSAALLLLLLALVADELALVELMLVELDVDWAVVLVAERVVEAGTLLEVAGMEMESGSDSDDMMGIATLFSESPPDITPYEMLLG